MSILDIFKKKEEEKKEPIAPEKKKEVKPKEEAKSKKPKKEEKKPIPIEKKKKLGLSYKALRFPHISEKATLLLDKNQYTFRVFPNANKQEVKKAVEEVYNVDVLSVNIIAIPRKSRKVGRISGWRKGYKKAIVKIKEGQKIEVLPR